MSKRGAWVDSFAMTHYDMTMVVYQVGRKEQLHWLDVVDPTGVELRKIGEQYGLHPILVDDCLEPEHLPKHERSGEVTFLIVRAFDESCSSEADSVQELTRKIAVFVSKRFLVTVHRKDQPWIERLRARWEAKNHAGEEISLQELFSDLMQNVLFSYEKPIDLAIEKLEALETTVFSPKRSVFSIEDGYYLKRRASLIKRMLRMTLDLIPKLHQPTLDSVPLFKEPVFLQDLRESGDNLFFYADELVENVNSLLSLHISLASHRTNEVVRVLTLFSVFFLPLNFIAGIYGMNFQYMPELGFRWGYPLVLFVMLVVSTVIFLWFFRRGWLK